MHTLYALEAQARQQEIARAAHHPSRLMAHELRLARAAATPAGVRTRRGWSVLRVSVVPRPRTPQHNLNGLHQG